MPKQRITKNMVVDAAFKIARQRGMEQVLVKNIADELGCSVQPIYSYCKNMDGLREEVGHKARDFIQEYIVSISYMSFSEEMFLRFCKIKIFRM